ncbi:LptF/LptG family permease [Aequorivita sp. Q41]|uniref:LptF/LptG family permease n=1 Tax=Aequorivita sp. Q41 TaxID=3153300 RepID=UPI00324213F6
MKILDRYILVTFLKTFLSVFIILMFIFVLQTIWLYISELAGKDLDVWIILKFLWYVSPRLIPLVLPLTILVTSLMVFGSFAEKYEFAAMKSTGISLQRAMGSVIGFIILLSITAFFFANNVIPYSEYKWQNLRRNISQLQPSMFISEGQFGQIGDDFNIKVEEKSGDRGQYLKDVVIHKKNITRPNGNFTVIIADNGEIASEEGSNTLSLILKQGNYYEEIQSNTPAKQKGDPFAKSYFDEYAINIDLTELNNKDLDKENDLNNQNMYNIRELRVEIDSLSESYTKDIESYTKNMYYRSGLEKLTGKPVRDTVKPAIVSSILEIYNPKLQLQIVKLALNNAKGTLQTVDAKKTEFKAKTKRLNKTEIALHEKYALGIACIILFFVGAPLGAIIRKGGMGLPMVIAILLFLTYHFIGIFAKNSAEDGTMHPFIATWISTGIMLPLSIWLTYRATTDQGVFDMDTFFQRIARLFGKKTTDAAIVEGEQAILLTQSEKALVLSRNNKQLIDIVKNYRQYGYSEEVRKAALQQLNLKGYSKLELKMSGDFENKIYSVALQSFNESSSFSKKGLNAYFISIICLIGMILFNNIDITYSETLKIIFQIGQVISLISLYILVIKTLFSSSKFYKVLGKEQDTGDWMIFMLLGPIIYIILHFNHIKKMKEELQMIY